MSGAAPVQLMGRDEDLEVLCSFVDRARDEGAVHCHCRATPVSERKRYPSPGWIGERHGPFCSLGR
jgi:hypothetical protein